MTLKRKRRKAEKKWKASGSEISKKEYKVLCNQVKDMVKKAKDEFYAQKVHECEGDQNELYKIIDSLMGRGKPNILPETNEWFTRWKINFRFIHILLQSYYYNRSMYNRTVIYYILSFLTFLKVYTG